MQRSVFGPDKDWLTATECAEWLRIGDTTFDELVRLHRFPEGVRMSKGKKVWGWMDCVAYAHLRSRMPELDGDGETVEEEEMTHKKRG